MTNQGSPEDFDFLLGTWHVRNRRLVERLAGSREWIEFSGRLEGGRKILNGLGIIDQLKARFDGGAFEGVSVRLFDPSSGTWTIYWSDTSHPKLTEQVVGHFSEGIGEFYGEELFENEPVRLRFLWSDISDDSVRWEQAYYDERREAWETNWVMEFTREERGSEESAREDDTLP